MLETERESHERTAAGIRKLESRMTFRFAILQRLLDRQIGRILARHDLTVPTYRIMATIEAFGELSAAGLARLTLMDKALISRCCGELARAGLIESRADPQSQRRRFLRVTDGGQVRLAGLRPELDARNAALAAVLTEDERATINAALEKLTTHVARSLDGDAGQQSAA